MQKLTKYTFNNLPGTSQSVIFAYGKDYDEALQNAMKQIAEESIVKEEKKSDTKKEVKSAIKNSSNK